MKKLLLLFSLLFTFTINAETYYQNNKSYTVVVPQANGKPVDIPPGKYVGGTYYEAFETAGVLVEHVGPDPAPSEIVYTYLVIPLADTILPDQTLANGKFLKSVLGTATWDNISIPVDVLTGTLTAGRVPYATGQYTVGDKSTLTFDPATDTLTSGQLKGAGTYLQDGYQSWFDTTAHNVNYTYRTVLLTQNGAPGGGFLQSKNHRYGFSSNAGIGDGDVAGNEDTYMFRAAAASMGFNGGIKLSTGSRPTCDATTRGTLWYVAGGAGVADTCEICRKDGADAYAWVTIF